MQMQGEPEAVRGDAAVDLGLGNVEVESIGLSENMAQAHVRR